MPRAFLLSLAAIGLAAVVPVLAADETYAIKIYQDKVGDKTTHENTEESKTDVLVKVMGNEMKDEKSSRKKEKFTEEILEKKDADKVPTKLSRHYTVVERTENGKDSKASYLDKKLIIEKKDDEYTITADGKALAKEDAPDLFKSFDKKKDELKTEDFLPSKAVKVGGTWTVPADKSEKFFKNLGEDKLKLDAKKSTISGKLVKAYKKDNAQFGVMEITVTGFVTELDVGGKVVPTTEGSKMVLVATVDTCIDGSVQFEDAKFKMELDITAEIANVATITVKGTSTSDSKVRVTK